MRVEQAVYGSSRGGHGLIAASGLNDMAQDLTSKLDLPDTIPNGVTWSPYISGFPLGHCYVLARTLADEQAARAGMVFSHALIVPIDHIIQFANMRQICSHLLTTPQVPATLSSIDLEEDLPTPLSLDTGAIETVNLLVSSSKKPVVRLGMNNFDDLVCNLWQMFWPELRRSFTFRMSFGPNDLVETPSPLLVCTPANLASRWSQFPIIVSNGPLGRTSPAAGLLTGDEQSGSLKPLLKTLSIGNATFTELALLDRLHDLYSLGAQNLDTTVAKLRLVEVLGKSQSVHAIGRDDLIDDFTKGVVSATSSQIRSLRNLELKAFEKEQEFWGGVTKWMGGYDFPSLQDVDSLDLLSDAYNSDRALPSWRGAIRSGLANANTANQGCQSRAFWRFAELCDSSNFSSLIDAFVPERISEELLVSVSPPKLSGHGISLLIGEAAKRNLLKLHAALTSAKFSPIEAAKMQLNIDREGADVEALRLCVRNADSQGLMTIALELKHRVFIRLAAERAVASPDVLASIDPLDETAQEIWIFALEKNKSVWNGPKQPARCMTLLLDQILIRETKVISNLLYLLSETPLGDLRRYKKRPALWIQLDGPVKQKLIAATGTKFLEDIRPDDSLPLEPELQSFILRSSDLTPAIKRTISSSSPFRLLSELSLMQDPQFRQLASLFNTTHLSAIQARSLGQLLNARKWSQSAEYLVHFARQGRDDIKAVLRECQGLLGFWDRLKLGLTVSNADEKWNSFAELGADLYPDGPTDREVWQRAGGKNADLIHHGDNRTRWYDAVYKIRRGYRLRSWELLEKMQEDFGWNEDLRALSTDPEFRRQSGS